VGSVDLLSNVICPRISSAEVSVGITVAASPVLSCAAAVSENGAFTITVLVSAIVTSFAPAAANSPSY